MTVLLTVVICYVHLNYFYTDAIYANQSELFHDAVEHILKNNETRRFIQMNATRRIINGREVGDTRPYMVYLRPASNVYVADPNWLCGGVIVHERYILTSAACIEDVPNFYVISGKQCWVSPRVQNDECIKYGAKRAVWKCVPKNYVFDGKDFDNIRWMIGDIAVVKTEDEFNFKRRIKGCDFIPQMIAYNNKSADMEKPGSRASTAGWGSTDHYTDIIARSSVNNVRLLETEIILIGGKKCKKMWPEKYHHVIDPNMVCGKDSADSDALSTLCNEREVNCKDLHVSEEESEEEGKEEGKEGGEKAEEGAAGEEAPAEDAPPAESFEELTRRQNASRKFAKDGKKDSRRSRMLSGGFCQNDHGGPLIVGYGKTSVVIGVVSAARVLGLDRKCLGPYLFTSVFKFRNLISCAINKDVVDEACRSALRSNMIQTTYRWPSQLRTRPEDSDNTGRNEKEKVEYEYGK